MKKYYKLIFLIAVILLSAFVLTGCSDSPTGDNTSVGSLSGVILGSEGSNLNDVKVEIGNQSTETNQNGGFTIENIEKGSYTLKASKSNYGETTEEIVVESGSNTLGELTVNIDSSNINTVMDQFVSAWNNKDTTKLDNLFSDNSTIVISGNTAPKVDLLDFIDNYNNEFNFILEDRNFNTIDDTKVKMIGMFGDGDYMEKAYTTLKYNSDNQWIITMFEWEGGF
mgnify:CR=1 FL=1